MKISTVQSGQQVRIVVEGVMDERNSALFKDCFRHLDFEVG